MTNCRHRATDYDAVFYADVDAPHSSLPSELFFCHDGYVDGGDDDAGSDVDAILLHSGQSYNFLCAFDPFSPGPESFRSPPVSS